MKRKSTDVVFDNRVGELTLVGSEGRFLGIRSCSGLNLQTTNRVIPEGGDK
jgi:hypothetical protein